MITEINTIESTDYRYRLVYPDGRIWERNLPFFAKSGDTLVLDKPYKVILVDPTTIYSMPALFLGHA